MATINYYFSLYYKGSDSSKAEFKKRMETAIKNKSIIIDEYEFYEEPTSIYFSMSGRNIDVSDAFIHLMQKFPELSYFFNVGESTNSGWGGYGCEYQIFEGARLIESNNWEFHSDSYDGEENPLELALNDKKIVSEKIITDKLNIWLEGEKVMKEITTIKEALAAVKKDGMKLEAIQYELRTPEVCLAAVKQNADAFEDVPEHLRVTEICLIAVQDGWALSFMPKESRTAEVCLAAVQQDSDALVDVPEHLKDLVWDSKTNKARKTLKTTKEAEKK